MECELSRILDDKNEPWLSGKCVGLPLGYKNTKSALIDHVDDDDRKTWECQRSWIATLKRQPQKRIRAICIDNGIKATCGKNL